MVCGLHSLSLIWWTVANWHHLLYMIMIVDDDQWQPISASWEHIQSCLLAGLLQVKRHCNYCILPLSRLNDVVHGPQLKMMSSPCKVADRLIMARQNYVIWNWIDCWAVSSCYPYFVIFMTGIMSVPYVENRVRVINTFKNTNPLLKWIQKCRSTIDHKINRV